MRTPLTRTLTYLTWIMVLVMINAAALAQTPAPQPNLRNAPPVWVGYLLMAVLMVIVVGVSLLPSKRSHQD